MAKISTFGRNLKALRESRMLTQGELADKVGVTITSLSGWETRGVARPKSQSVVDGLCNVLGCTEQDLFGISDGFYAQLTAPAPVRHEEPADTSPEGCFTVTMADGSMSEVIPEGFEVLIDPSKLPGRGEPALVSVDGGEPMVRAYRDDDGITVLSPRSHDDAYRRLVVDTTAPDAPTVRVLGTVVRAWREWENG